MAGDVFGVASAFARLDKLQVDVREAADAGHRDLADTLAADIRQGAPVDTGRLVGTVRVERGSEVVTEVAVGDESTEYLGFQEFGTYRQDARPFVRPAVARSEVAHEAVMTREAKARIK